MKIFKVGNITILILILFLGVCHFAFAISIVPVECQGDAKITDCNLQSVVNAGLNIAQLILSVSGSLILGAFVWAGIKLITSAGESKKVTEAKEMVKNTVLGLAIILLAGVIVKLLLKKLTGVG